MNYFIRFGELVACANVETARQAFDKAEQLQPGQSRDQRRGGNSRGGQGVGRHRAVIGDQIVDRPTVLGQIRGQRNVRTALRLRLPGRFSRT